MFKLGLRTCIAAAAISVAASAAVAQTPAEFYKGKTVEFVIGYATGGSNDTYSRMIAQHMGKHIPGNPTVVVRNMPGAGHLIGANALYASRPDGLTIGSFSTGLIYNQISRNSAVQFDLARMSWIGKAASDPRVIVVAAQSPITSFADLMAQKQPVNIASAGPGSASYVETVMLTFALKMPVRNLTGYTGTEDQLAMRRGEKEMFLMMRVTLPDEATAPAEVRWADEGGRVVLHANRARVAAPLGPPEAAVRAARVRHEVERPPRLRGAVGEVQLRHGAVAAEL
jgi:tripartite-type tricarboxylate transporter receptor subunit TctC